ncbi:rhomboid family intramembrane serine protease [Pedobacter sp. PWIIR3]
MSINWGYSPKIEKFIPLGGFPADRYLIIAQQAIENLGWKLSHLSASGIIAYTGLSAASYSEEISIRIKNNFAIFKSECIGVQLLFNDYGKNTQNKEKFFAEFDYVEFHLKDIWEERIESFNQHIVDQDDNYFNQAPLTAKDKIKNVLYLFLPQPGYVVTPLILNLNFIYYILLFGVLVVATLNSPQDPQAAVNHVYLRFGVGERNHVLEGEFWRLITQLFVHFSFWHLFFNMYTLVYIGLMIENKLGSGKTLAVYFMGGACASILSIYSHHTGFLGGASGAILGMFGAFLALLISRAFEKNANKALLISTVILVTYMLINGYFGKRVDNTAHVAGLVAGFIFGYLFYNPILFKRKVSSFLRYGIAGAAFILLVLGTYLFLPRYQTEEYVKLRQEFIANDETFSGIFFQLRSELSKKEKLAVIKQSAIAPVDRNFGLINKMKKLTLLEAEEMDLKYRIKMIEKAHFVALSLYKYYRFDAPDNWRLKKDIQKGITEINKLKYEQSQ